MLGGLLVGISGSVGGIIGGGYLVVLGGLLVGDMW